MEKRKNRLQKKRTHPVFNCLTIENKRINKCVVSVVVRYPWFFRVFLLLTTTWRSGKLSKENEFYFYLLSFY
jgi:hypothetical protein